MARTRSLTNLIADVRQRTNQENSTFVTDAEITEYLNQELAELHGRLTMVAGHPYFRSSQAYPVTAGTSLYALPADFWQVQEVDAYLDGIRRTLQPFMAGERAGLSNTNVYFFPSSPSYRVQAGNIEFLPADRTYTATLYYVRSSPRLSAGADTFDGFNGYEVAAIYGTCATILQKEEADPNFYLGLRQAQYRRIDAEAAHRDASNPERVTDVVGIGDSFGWWPGRWT